MLLGSESVLLRAGRLLLHQLTCLQLPPPQLSASITFYQRCAQQHKYGVCGVSRWPPRFTLARFDNRRKRCSGA